MLILIIGGKHMNTTLFYFSGRGNALNAARIIAGKLGDTQLVPIYKALNEKVDLSAERIGFAFPVIDLGMPSGTMLQVRNRFKAKGFKLSAGFFLLSNGKQETQAGLAA